MKNTTAPTFSLIILLYTPPTAYEEVPWKTCALVSYKGIGLGIKRPEVKANTTPF